jgi:transposase
MRPFMDELIKLLSENLEYVSHEIINDTIYIRVKSIREILVCPYCNGTSDKVHSLYERSFQDLPIQGKKVVIFINNRKMFCKNSECKHKTFAETYDFLMPKGKKTRRLEDEIVKLSLNVSSITASYLLSERVATVGKSTICNLLKKINTNNEQRGHS